MTLLLLWQSYAQVPQPSVDAGGRHRVSQVPAMPIELPVNLRRVFRFDLLIPIQLITILRFYADIHVRILPMTNILINMITRLLYNKDIMIKSMPTVVADFSLNVIKSYKKKVKDLMKFLEDL